MKGSDPFLPMSKTGSSTAPGKSQVYTDHHAHVKNTVFSCPGEDPSPHYSIGEAKSETSPLFHSMSKKRLSCYAGSFLL